MRETNPSSFQNVYKACGRKCWTYTIQRLHFPSCIPFLPSPPSTVSLVFHTHASLRVFKLKFKMPAEYSIFSKRKASSAGQPSVHSYILIVSGICCLLPKCRKRLLNRVSYVVRSLAGLLMSSVTWKHTTLRLRSFCHFV